MATLLRSIITTLFVALSTSTALAAESTETVQSSVRLSDVQYFHRWSQNEQHEFTPQGQEELTRWTDMVTINYYRQVKDGDGLAMAANAVLENYKANRAMVVRTDSVAATPTTPAEHLIVVLFPQPEFVEAAFARFRIVDGVGLSVVYSHRKYGQKIGSEMSAWLQANGPATEKALMGIEQIPILPEPKK
jgi:hypothetical protein